MTSYVALLRAVNVGGKTLSMADLRPALEGLNLRQVQTYVQSGNVLFAAEGDGERGFATAIEQLIERDFALETKALVFAARKLAEIAAANPFFGAGADEKFLHATFLFEPLPEAAFADLQLPAQDGELAALATSGMAVYLHLPHGYGRSKLNNAFFERSLKTPATTRNWRTVLALVELSSQIRS